MRTRLDDSSWNAPSGNANGGDMPRASQPRERHAVIERCHDQPHILKMLGL